MVNLKMDGIKIEKDKSSRVYEGISASFGIAVGTVCLYATSDEAAVPHYIINDKQVDSEIKRLEEALEKARHTLENMVRISEKILDKKAGEIFNAHLFILNDIEIFNKIANLIRDNKVNAEHAVNDAFQGYLEYYSKKEGHFFELRHDVTDVRDRIIASFHNISGHFVCPVGDKQSVIVASKHLTPSMVMEIPQKNVLAFVVKEGGYTSHATILARSFGVPVIFGLDVENILQCGDEIIVDGFSGKIFVWPDKDLKVSYLKKIEEARKKAFVCEQKREFPLETKSGHKIKLQVNLSSLEELDNLHGLPIDGVGLLRTEFLFLHSKKPPSENEQYKIYNDIAKIVGNKPITIRLFDVAVDKLPAYLILPPQDNPDLGIRGARALEVFPEIYATQIRAILRAGYNSDIRILYPMVSDMSDLLSFRQMVNDAKKQLKKDGNKFNSHIQEGIMIEVPSAAILSEELLKEVDFANIGSNDLFQYTLAASRGLSLVQKRYHILHPALIKMMEISLKAAKKHKKEICLCGEISSFENFYPVFLHMGLKSFSVPIAQFMNIKCEILHIHPKVSQEQYKKFVNG